MQASLFTAVGLMLVLEGLMPLLLPQAWREAFQRLMAFKDGQLRFVGMLSVLVGLLLIWVTNR
ncbi:Protein of unknown function DUF2065 [Methylophilaceae bacterium]